MRMMVPMTAESVTGAIPEIFFNDDALYEGDLVDYFPILWNNARNLEAPYHNYRHIGHFVVMAFQACMYHREDLTPRQIRNILLAGTFHDFNHTGMPGPDRFNIEAAVEALGMHLYPEDQEHFETIKRLIEFTEFPYQIPSEGLDLSGKIMRDADMSQALSTAWVQQVIIGLAAEQAITPTEMLKRQRPFLEKVMKFHTEWGQTMFPKEAVQAKVAEAERYLEMLARRRPVLAAQ